jgi:ribonuclease-3|tara:strand:+ start:6733 stop:7572 length:840 start_codon:yes stop_codon:yes gene_type:complete
MNVSQQEVEQLVGTKIKDLSLYQKAFTHKSALKEHENLTQSFETLEFMGDSVLGFVITKWLFDKFEDKQEGFLTKARTKLVRSETLASIALKLGLNKLVLMDEKGMRNEWNNNPKILEDVFEALVGAIYMDCGLLHAKQFILGIYENPEFIDLNCIMVDDNFKDHLMRYCQTNNYELPEYRVLSQENGLFVIGAIVQNRQLGQGYAKSKKQAEQNAARSVFLPAFGGGDLPKSNVANVPPIKHHQPPPPPPPPPPRPPPGLPPKTVKIHKFRDESEIIR